MLFINANMRLHVQIPLPRKGTETSKLLHFVTSHGFKFHYPARGRKPRHYKGCNLYRLRFKFHYPARGRKPVVLPLNQAPCMVQIPLPRKGTETSPLGSIFVTSEDVQIPLPRKGTETSLILNVIDKALSSNSITPQGDGNAQS